MTTVRELLAEAVERFESAGLAYGHGTTNAHDEAAWMILYALRLPLTDLAAHLDRPLSPAQARAARALVARRIRTRKPAAYLTNEAWLGSHRFYVDERVIVPRSYIFELLPASSRAPAPAGDGAESGAAPALELGPRRSSPPNARLGGGGDGRARSDGPMRILDLCTGSGCLAILAALAFPKARVDAVDLSEDALAVAKRNVSDYRLAKRIRLVRSDLFAALQRRTYDLIISNPPYVKAASMRRLPDEHRKEPAMALASGVDGLDHTRTILLEARRHLAPGGLLVVEIGHNRRALERAWPRLPFRWPRTSGGPGYVFTLRREDLPEGA